MPQHVISGAKGGEGCGVKREHYALGLCRTCWRRQYERGRPHKRKFGWCPDCKFYVPIVARGLCAKHYAVWWRKQQEAET